MTLAFDHQVLDPAQSRLRLRTELVVAPHDDTTFVLEDPMSGKFFMVGAAEWSFLAQLDGTNTIAEAIGRAATQAGRQNALTEQEGVAVARWLLDQSLAQAVDSVLVLHQEGPKRKSTSAARFNPLAIRLGSMNPDRFLAAANKKLGWLWSKQLLMVWLCLGVGAAIKLSSYSTAWWALPRQILDSQNWIRMGLVWCVLKVIHESGHALSCRHFGIPVRRAGLLLIFFAPVPFVDVSASWRLASRWQRIVISAAGMYLELMVAFAALLYWTPDSAAPVDRLCVDLVLLAGLNTLVINGNPLMRFDGYYILADLVGVSNLYNRGQQRLGEFARYYLRGQDARPTQEPTFERLAVSSYGVLSFGWRLLAFVGIALSLVAKWSWWGGLAAIPVGWYWFGIPLPGRRPPKEDQGTSSRAAIRRQRIVLGVVGTCGLLFAAWLLSSAHVSAPAVVEYAPLTVLRSKASGFVTQVHVREGQKVEAGDLLLELVNDELANELKRVDIEIEQTLLRSRSYLNQNDLPKQQKELALLTSLEKKRNELKGQSDGLQVRSPCAATVASRDLEKLAGHYVEMGEVLLVLGAEDQKELLVSVASSDEKDFVAQLNEPVNVYRELSGAAIATGRLSHVEPRASENLPHAALGADSGGDVVVNLDKKVQDESGQQTYLALTSRLVAKVALDSVHSQHYRAGQRVTVSLPESTQTWGGKLIAAWRDYLTEVSAGERAVTGSGS